MKNSVVIKGNKYGIIVMLDATIEFEELKEQTAEKFKESPKGFFGSSSLAISFEGRDLTNEEIKELLDVISENSDLNIAYVIDSDKEKEEYFKNILEANGRLSSEISEDKKVVGTEDNISNNDINDNIDNIGNVNDATYSAESYQSENYSDNVYDNSSENNDGQFYRGTLRSGQVIESENSIVILGDVNPGARVISAGNVIILGSLKGNVFAGANGTPGCFVVALEMEPMQIRIGDYIARASDEHSKKSKKNKKPETKIAFVEDGNIYIETLNKEVLNDIHF